MPAMMNADADLVIDAKTLTAYISQAFSEDRISVRQELSRLIAERILVERWADISAQITNEEIINAVRVSLGAFVFEKLMGPTR